MISDSQKLQIHRALTEFQVLQAVDVKPLYNQILDIIEEKKREYPNPCCRCGLCCLTEVCPMGMKVYGLDEKHQLCPALTFDEDDNAVCMLVVKGLTQAISYEHVKSILEAFGIGAGCCIKARAYYSEEEYDFASLPPEIKKMSAAKFRDGKQRGLCNG